jgi:tetratricopeptide (TPR) repeat protein
MCIRTTSIWLLLVALITSAGNADAQSIACSEATPAAATPAAEAYQHAKYEEAEGLYRQELALRANDQDLTAGLVHTLLREDRISDASNLVEKASADAPHSAALLTALAEVQLRKGQPWLALQTLDAAAGVDPCYARAHLIRGRIFRIDSKYASERAELQAAYQIAPSDPDIKRAWTHTVNPANDILRIEESLATMHDLDADTRERVRASANGMMSLLSENSQTCQASPLANPTTLPLIPTYENIKQVSAYKLEVQFAKSKARLIVDTAASGLYISRTLAENNGFEHKEGAPPNTVQVEDLHIGSLEFRNCMVGVSETPFADGVEGYIGTDIFAPYLLTLNFPLARLDLGPLPLGKQANDLPGDRDGGPDVQTYAPVYHRNQYLLVPVLLNKKDRRLFVLDSGIRLSTMTSEVAHSISNTKLNFTNSVKTISGSTLQIYRDSFDFQFANLSLDRRDHILEFDPTAVEQNAGMEIAGMLGFDILHSLVLHIDYRDGLVKFDSAAAGSVDGASTASQNTAALSTPGSAASDPACNQYANQNADRPLNSAIRGNVTDRLDSAHLKPGQPITVKVVRAWIAPSCALTAGSMLYGHVLAATTQKKTGASELAVVFDHGDCSGHPKQVLLLRIIGVRDSTASSSVHNAMPTEVSGGARDISSTAGSMGHASDDDMKAGAAIVRPGIVFDIPQLQLIPEGGPDCSAKLVSQKSSVHLDTGTEFILTMQALPE